MKFFSIDSPFYRFMQRLWDVCKLNLIWLLFSLPVITIGGSTIAAFSVTLKMTEEREGDIIRDFIKGFKENWKQGIPMSVLMFVCPLAVWYDFQLFNNMTENALPFLIVGMFAAYIFTLSLVYAFALLARYENTVINCLMNSFRLSMKYFGRTLILIAVLVVEFVIWFWNYTTIFVGLLIGPVCVMYTISGTAMYIFRDMEKIPGTTRGPNPETEHIGEGEIAADE